jgi:ArsR family metal-binding transcriptional regulator
MATITIKITSREGYDPFEVIKDAINEAWASNRDMRNPIENTKLELVSYEG